jgi:nucleotide-binding universal stress UspA family protein
MHPDVLVAVDGSETSMRALRTALPLCRQGRARVLSVLLSPDRLLSPWLSESTEHPDLVALMEAHEDQLAAALSEIDTDIVLTPEVVCGQPAEMILSYARSSANQLIVMGPGEHGLLGSTVERVIRKSPVPILIAGQAARQTHPTTYLVALDFSAPSRRALHAALALAALSDGRVEVITVVPEPMPGLSEDRLRTLEQRQRELIDAALEGREGLPCRCTARLGVPLEVLSARLAKDPPNLLLVGACGDSGRPPGTLTRRLIRCSPVPLLVCP